MLLMAIIACPLPLCSWLDIDQAHLTSRSLAAASKARSTLTAGVA